MHVHVHGNVHLHAHVLARRDRLTLAQQVHPTSLTSLLLSKRLRAMRAFLQCAALVLLDILAVLAICLAPFAPQVFSAVRNSMHRFASFIFRQDLFLLLSHLLVPAAPQDHMLPHLVHPNASRVLLALFPLHFLHRARSVPLAPPQLLVRRRAGRASRDCMSMPLRKVACFALRALSVTAPVPVPPAPFVQSDFLRLPDHRAARRVQQEHTAHQHPAALCARYALQIRYRLKHPPLAHFVPPERFLSLDPLHAPSVSQATCWMPLTRASPALPESSLTPAEHRASLAALARFQLPAPLLARTARWAVTAFSAPLHAGCAQWELGHLLQEPGHRHCASDVPRAHGQRSWVQRQSPLAINAPPELFRVRPALSMSVSAFPAPQGSTPPLVGKRQSAAACSVPQAHIRLSLQQRPRKHAPLAPPAHTLQLQAQSASAAPRIPFH